MKSVFKVLALTMAVLTIAFCSSAEGKNRKKSSKPSADQKIAEQKPETYVFPVDPGRARPFKPAEKVLTGVFTGKGKEPAALESKAYDGLPSSDSAAGKKVVSRKKTAESISWVTRDGQYYHDPLLDLCASATDMIWINDHTGLCGLEPCRECFIKTAHVPEFIKKESGGLELATAGVLLDNAAFLRWLVEKIPVKNPAFLSTRKLLVYPSLEVTENGMRQLVREVELAYRRQTWKIIEVAGKMNELDTRIFSSFDRIDSDKAILKQD